MPAIPLFARLQPRCRRIDASACGPGRPALVVCSLLSLIVGASSPVTADLPQARLYAIFPCGGRAGSKLDVTLTQSADMDEANRLVFSHPGITGTPKLQTVAGKRQPVPNVFEVTIGKEVPSGIYEMFAKGVFGLSNPRAFVVNSDEEVNEVEPNNDREKANELKLNRIVNGASNAETDVDFFRFAGKKGDRIVATCRAADLDSRMIPVVEVSDTQGRRLGYARQQLRHDPVVDVLLPADGDYVVKVHDFLFRGGPEYVYRLSAGTAPHLDFILPPVGIAGATGKFTLFGRNLPGGRPANVTVDGRPLQRLDVEIPLPAAPPLAPAHTLLRSADAGVAAFSYVLKSSAGESNCVLIEPADSPPVLEREPNDTPATAQKIAVPGEFCGQFQAPGDTDYITFDARAGQVFYLDVYSDRLGSPADPTLVLEQVSRDPKGRESVTRITSLDDDNISVEPNVFETRSDDPSYRFEAPADGTYRVMLRDRSFESRGDPRMVYRLSIRPEHPDFQLVVLPLREGPPPAPRQPGAVSTWSLGLRKGDSRPVQVLALRRDGFREPIDVWAEGLPKGVMCRGTTIPSNAKVAELIFTASEDAPEWGGLIRVFGKAPKNDLAKLAALAAARQRLDNAMASAKKAEIAEKQAAEIARVARQLVESAKRAAESAGDKSASAVVVADANRAAESAALAAAKAAEKLTVEQGKLRAARTAHEAAQGAAKPAEIRREAAPATIVWSAQQSAPPQSRLGQALALSVLNEPAPFHVSTSVERLEVNQSRQILLPLSISRRNGFDGELTATLKGVDGESLETPLKSIPRGTNSMLLRLFVKPTARAGSYSLYWKLKAPVQYQRNLAAANRAKEELADAAKQATALAAAAKKAKTLKDAAVKKVADLTAALKSAKQSLASSQQAITTAEQTERAARTQHEAAEQAAIERSAVAEAAARVASFAEKAAEEAAGALQAASPANKKEADARTAAAAKVASDAKKVAEGAAAQSRAALQALAAADKRLKESRLALKQAVDAAAAAAKAAADAVPAVRAAEEAKQRAEAAATRAAQAETVATAEKTRLDQVAQQAIKAAAPQKLDDESLSTPVLLTIKRAPVQLSLTVPKAGSLKKGSKLDVKVRLRRKSGFEGPATIDLPLPPGLKGIEASPVVIPADQREAVISIRAGANAPNGPVANLVVRAHADFDGTSEVDSPLAINVVP